MNYDRIVSALIKCNSYTKLCHIINFLDGYHRKDIDWCSKHGTVLTYFNFGDETFNIMYQKIDDKITILEIYNCKKVLYSDDKAKKRIRGY